jgi:hypothetical protein
MVKMRSMYKILVGKPERQRPLGRLGIDGRIILEWIVRKYSGKMWTGCVWLVIETTGRLL